MESSGISLTHPLRLVLSILLFLAILSPAAYLNVVHVLQVLNIFHITTPLSVVGYRV